MSSALSFKILYQPAKWDHFILLSSRFSSCFRRAWKQSSIKRNGLISAYCQKNSTWGLFCFFASTGFRGAERETFYCYCLSSIILLEKKGYPFDILLLAWRSFALCLVLPRSGTEQQYAQAFSLLPPLHPPHGSEPSIIQLWEGVESWGVGTSWPGEHWQQSQSPTMTSSLQDWQAMRTLSALTRLSPHHMHKLACADSHQWATRRDHKWATVLRMSQLIGFGDHVYLGSPVSDPTRRWRGVVSRRTHTWPSCFVPCLITIPAPLPTASLACWPALTQLQAQSCLSAVTAWTYINMFWQHDSNFTGLMAYLESFCSDKACSISRTQQETREAFSYIVTDTLHTLCVRATVPRGRTPLPTVPRPKKHAVLRCSMWNCHKRTSALQQRG